MRIKATWRELLFAVVTRGGRQLEFTFRDGYTSEQGLKNRIHTEARKLDKNFKTIVVFSPSKRTSRVIYQHAEGNPWFDDEHFFNCLNFARGKK